MLTAFYLYLAELLLSQKRAKFREVKQFVQSLTVELGFQSMYLTLRAQLTHCILSRKFQTFSGDGGM